MREFYLQLRTALEFFLLQNPENGPDEMEKIRQAVAVEESTDINELSYSGHLLVQRRDVASNTQ